MVSQGDVLSQALGLVRADHWFPLSWAGSGCRMTSSAFWEPVCCRQGEPGEQCWANVSSLPTHEWVEAWVPGTVPHLGRPGLPPGRPSLPPGWPSLPSGWPLLPPSGSHTRSWAGTKGCGGQRWVADPRQDCLPRARTGAGLGGREEAQQRKGVPG